MLKDEVERGRVGVEGGREEVGGEGMERKGVVDGGKG